MKRSVMVVVLCLVAGNFAFATGDIYLVDAGGLQFDIKTDVTSSAYTTCSTWTWTTTWTWSSCWPTTTTFGGTSSTCWTSTWWSPWTTSTCWTTGSTDTASGAAREAGYTQAVSASTVGGGMTIATLGDAFDGYNLALLRRNEIDTRYANNGAPTVEDNGRQIVFPTQLVGNLQFYRKVFVPDNDEFCRWLNVVTNTGPDPEVVVLKVEGNLGSDENTLIVDTSSGDTLADTADSWIVSMEDFDGTTSGDPRLGHVLQGEYRQVGVSAIEFVNGDDNTLWQYEFVLAPGQTGIIMNFVTGQPTIDAARDKAIELYEPQGNALAYMTDDEKEQVFNFRLTPYALLTVNSLGDDVTPGDGLVTLREAVNSANMGVPTDLGGLPGVFNYIDMTEITGSVVLGSSLPQIASTVVIEGPEAPHETPYTGVIVDGHEQYRVFEIAGGNLTLRNLMIHEGASYGGDGSSSPGGGGGGGALGAGGAVFMVNGAFKAVNVFFDGNAAVGGDGGWGEIFKGAGGGGGGGMGGPAIGCDGGPGGVLGGVGGGCDGSAGGPGAGGGSNAPGLPGGAGGWGGGGGGGGAYFDEFTPGGNGGAGGFGAGGGGGGAASPPAPPKVAVAMGGPGGEFGSPGQGGTNIGGGGGGGAALGGALFLLEGTAVLEGCTFQYNYAHGGVDGGVVKAGGGQGQGGAIFLGEPTEAWQNGCSFDNNTASTGNPDVYGQFAPAGPVVVSMTKLDADPATGNSVRYLVQFSVPVTGVDISDFEILGDLTTSPVVTPFDASSYIVTVEFGDAEGVVWIYLDDDDTIVDSELDPLGGEGLGNGDFESDYYTVDNITPNAPILEGESTPADNDLTWSWASGGGGNGTFRWCINSGAWTETTELTVTEKVGYGVILFEVQERDDAGNWSESASWEVIVRQRLYVSFDSSVADPDGVSWETAFSLISDALFSAQTDYVDVWVAGGIYPESVDLPGLAALYGGFAGTETELEQRRLDGFPSVIAPIKVDGAKPDGLGGIVVYGPETVIDGFAITAVSGYMPPKEVVSGAVTYLSKVRLTKEPYAPHWLRNCTISGNQAGTGGGVYLSNGISVVMENCILSGNSSYNGSAVYVNYHSDLLAINCTFSDNLASEGAAVYLDSSTGQFINCLFDSNVLAAVWAMSENKQFEVPVFTNCLFNNNAQADCVVEFIDYTGADAINALPGSSGNVDGDSVFVMRGADAISGTVTDFSMPMPFALVITDSAATFSDALAGKLVELVLEPTLAPPKLAKEVKAQLLIQDVEEDSLTVLLPGWVYDDIYGGGYEPVSYTVVDYQVMPGSAAIDTGTPEGAPSADIVGTTRPIDVPGYGAEDTGTEWDIGAYELYVLRVVSVTRGDPSPTNAQTVTFLVTFSEAVNDLTAGDLSIGYSGSISDPIVVDIYTEDHIIFEVTVDTGTGDGALQLDVIDNDTITNADGDYLGGEGIGNGDFTGGEEYVIDKTAPQISGVEATPNIAKAGTTVEIAFSLDESPSSLEVTVNGNPATNVTTKRFYFTYMVQETDPDGCATVAITVADAAGNTSTFSECSEALLVIDNTPPVFSSFVATPSVGQSGSTTTLVFTSSEELSANPTVTLGGAVASFVGVTGSLEYTYTCTVPVAPDGPLPAVITGADPAGNEGMATFTDFVVDNTPPEFAILAAPGRVKAGDTVAITVTASEDVASGVPLVTLNGTNTTLSSQVGLVFTYDYLVTPADIEGWATLQASGEDLAGNEGSNMRNDAVFIDLTPPTFANIAADPALAKEGGTVAITFTASEDLIANPAVTVNSNAAAYVGNTGLDYTYTYTVLPADPDGAAAIVVTGADLAGNIGAGDSNALIIDKTPPAFESLAAAPNLAKLGTVVTITFTSSEVLGGPPVVTVNGNPATPPAPGKAAPYAFMYTVQESDPDGLATIVITGSDPAGNETTTTADNILTIDKTPPAFTEIAANPASIQQATSTTITFKASEELVADPVVTVNGHGAVFVSVDVLPDNVRAYTFGYTALMTESLGAATIAIQGEDLAGNVGTATDEEALTIVPPEPPTAEIGPPSVLATNTGPVSFTVTYSSNAAEITLSAADVSLAGDGTTASVAVTGAVGFERLVTLSSISGDGTIGISIAAGTATNAFDQSAAGAGPSDLVDVDNTAPVITVLGDNPASIMVRDTYTDAGATASDTRDGDLTSAIQTDNTVDANTPGQYTVTYSVADSVGNTAEAVRTVNVEAYETCVQFLFPLDGSTITVDGSEDFWLVPIIEADTGEAIASVEFFLDSTLIGESTVAPYTVPYNLPASAATYELTARAFDAEGQLLCENFSNFSVVVAEEGDDTDGNGLPDNPFTLLPDTGSTWFSETGGVSTVVSTLYNCEDTPEPIVLTLVGAEQVMTMTAPAGLFTGCEMAVVIFQMAPSIATLLGSAEAAVVQPEPEGNLAAGWNYYLCTILISEDGGGTFEEIDPARLAANPVNLVVAGTAVPNSAVFYTHGIYADSDALTGVKITGVPGAWDTSGVANVQLFGVAAQLDVVKPTLFAPYVLKAEGDENPPAWPWLLLLAALLGISLAGGGDDGGGGGPCFIATAAYGTPMASEVDALRELRDEYLLGSAVGTAFVDAYYRVSPAVAGVVGAHPALAWGIRLVLGPVILLSRALLVAPGAVALAALGVAWLAVLRRRKGRRVA